MSITLADLRKNRGTSDFNKITKALVDSDKNQSSNDDDSMFWKPTRDKAGNGTAEIRFLPAYQGEDAVAADELPWVKVYSHSFQGPSGRWYIENCRSTIGEDDPVLVMNRELYKGGEEEKKQAKAQKRKLAYISQIKVVSDPANPDNNGKVFFFKYGKKIFEKIMDKAKPTFEDEKPVNVFDLWEGANFKLRIKQVDGFPNYDSSEFKTPGPVASSDEDILEVVNQQKSLGQFVDPSKFKSYEELEKKMKSVLNPNSSSTRRAEDIAQEMRQEATARATSAPAPAPVQEKVSTPAPVAKSADEDDMDDFFANLGND